MQILALLAECQTATIRASHLHHKPDLHLLPQLRLLLHHLVSLLVLHPHKLDMVDLNPLCHPVSTILRQAFHHHHKVFLDLHLPRALHRQVKFQDSLRLCHRAFKLAMDVDDEEVTILGDKIPPIANDAKSHIGLAVTRAHVV
jgi:hypothetical protein